MSSNRAVILDSGNRLEIKVRWLGGNEIIFAIGLLIPILWAGYESNTSFSLGPLGFIPIAFAIYFLYVTICLWVNATIVVADRSKIAIRYRPLYWPGGKNVDATGIESFAVERISGAHSTEYRVIARTNGKDISLADFGREEDANFVVWHIHRFLGVPGSLL